VHARAALPFFVDFSRVPHSVPLPPRVSPLQAKSSKNTTEKQSAERACVCYIH